MVIQERYAPLVVGVNATVTINNQAVAGFVCQTAGTVTLTSAAVDGAPAVTILSAFPVTAGVYYPLPFFLGKNGGTFTTAGGASGTLAL
jgi:hypothetical protein